MTVSSSIISLHDSIIFKEVPFSNIPAFSAVIADNSPLFSPKPLQLSEYEQCENESDLHRRFALTPQAMLLRQVSQSEVCYPNANSMIPDRL
ncbi:hypothetical protein TNCV_3845241 [Trichonephila clavipes]|nr:hypothetical protein TNCV_3845241 [Trichonephila clavipes]